MSDSFDPDAVYDLMISRTHQGISLNDIVGGGDPRREGASAVSVLSAQQLLTPSSRVLEIGAGCGRAAVALADVVTEGSYIGVDILPVLTDFCAEQITPHRPRFTFKTMLEGNPQYDHHVTGPGRVENIRRLDELGCDFDLVFAFSVFTHLQPAETLRMLQQARAVLRPGGRILLTTFLLDPFSRVAIQEGRAAYFTGVQGVADSASITDEFHGPNSAVAYELNYIGRLLTEAGFDALLGLRTGSWRAVDSPHFQDVIFAGSAPRLPAGFNGEEYLRRHVDVAQARVNAAHHYLTFGHREGRPLR